MTEVIKGNILIVDDEIHIREILAATLTPLANKIFTAESADKATQLVLEENLDVVVCDIQMPGMDGLEFLSKVKQEQPDIKFLMITAHTSVDKVISALRSGASDFLSKPFENANVRSIVSKLIKEKSMRTEPLQAPELSKENSGIIGKSQSFQKSLNIALKAAATDSNVLILGESGTGKEVFARCIHENSSRAKNPFIAINCGAIPENLIESELFGHEKGAFSGALDSKPGKFALANTGTIFLDEIGEMPLQLQVKLLRVLQEKTIDPLGSSQSIPIDFRLVAATNKDLKEEIALGNFREDLYYRLNIIPIQLPPLRDRKEDVADLANFFLENFNNRYNCRLSLSPAQIQMLISYNWPGNIRELENTVERAVVLGDADLGLQLDLPGAESNPVSENGVESTGLKKNRQLHEKEEIIKALEKHRWNKTKAAEDLGISRRSLLYKVKEYEIN